ncbi:DUF883 family protein [Arcobacter sp. YIC-80]|uniref:DUF883 family protein n=1 Tax=unclassified Arcobacter TaxID=2593671 RepID=UPI00384F3463
MATAQEVTKLKEEINDLKSDLKSLTETMKEIASSNIDREKSKLLDELSIEELTKKVESLKTKGLEEVDEVEKRIKKDPLKSVAITFGVGFIAAWLLKR